MLQADSVVKAWRRWTAPLRHSTPRSRLEWLCMTLAISALVAGGEHWFYENYRIGWDRQVLKCLDSSFFLVSLKDTEIKRDKLYAFTTKAAEPVIHADTVMAKYVRGVPGDVVEVRKDDETVRINGKIVATGLPHLRKIPPEQAERFFGKRVLQEDEYWVMGTKFLSFDSRYWGAIHASDIKARAYELF